MTDQREDSSSEALPVDIYDSAAAASLVRYALASQLARLPRAQYAAGSVVGKTPQTMSRLVRGSQTSEGSRRALNPAELRHLVEVQDAIMAGGAGAHPHASLVAFHGRLFPDEKSDVTVPARWAKVLTRETPRSFAEVLLAGEAVLAYVARQGRTDVDMVDTVLRRLTVLAGLPGPEGVESLQLIARFSDVPFCRRSVFEHIAATLRDSPTGFRAWRAVSFILRRAIARDHDAAHLHAVRGEVEQLFEHAPEMAHPSRSLDIEAAAATPPEWEWATERLAREVELDTTPRRLGYAALAYFERTKPTPGRRAVLARFRDRAQAEASPHMTWVADNVAMLMRPSGRIDELPHGDVRRQVDEVAKRHFGRGRLPARLSQPTVTLFVHALMSNHGRARRLALDTLRVAALAPAVYDALVELTDRADAPAWTIERAAFAVSMMGEATAHAEHLLRSVVSRARVDGDSERAIEAAAWSVGELFASDDGRAVPGWAVDRLLELASVPDVDAFTSRAAAYSLAMTAPPAARRRLQQLGPSLGDDYARRFAELALWRLRDDERVVPLVELPRAVPIADFAPWPQS